VSIWDTWTSSGNPFLMFFLLTLFTPESSHRHSYLLSQPLYKVALIPLTVL